METEASSPADLNPERKASFAALPWGAGAQASAASAELARELALPEVLVRVMLCRGLRSASEIRDFLQPTLDHLHAPGRMLGMAVAVGRLRAALAAGEPILLYGDYDVDGTVATVLLKTAAERTAAAMGVKADVRYHIPHRLREGYGLQEARLAAAAAEGVRLVVSVDTGIRAFAAAEQCHALGLDLIVTDHHLPDERLGMPRALAVLNPHQPGCGYPYKELCGAGVAFKLAQALLESAASSEAERQRLREKTLPSFLKLLAIATIADAVPLTGENRTIAALGLRALRQPAQAGLRTLMQLAGIEFGAERTPSAMDVGFRLAPRINAAGRMDVASDVVEMFLTRDAELARTLAEKLHRLNDERRASEAEALRAIERQMSAAEAADAGLPACLVLDDEGSAEGARWHRGVIGILASRVVDRTARPALVLTHEDGVAYGSGRSVPGFHLLDALTAVHSEGATPLLARFGGHAHAVGFSLASEQVPELRRRLELYAAGRAGELTPAELECDAELPLGEITPAFLAALEQMAPFGQGAREPVFVSRGVRLASAPRAVQQRHLRVTLEDPGGDVRFSGMAWARQTSWAAVAEQQGWAQGQRLDAMFRLQRNWHPEFGGWELEVLALRDAVAE